MHDDALPVPTATTTAPSSSSSSYSSSSSPSPTPTPTPPTTTTKTTPTHPDQRPPNRRLAGVVFDMDGVLVHGHTAIPQARAALARLARARVPYVVLTNGGGRTEAFEAARLTRLLCAPSDDGVPSAPPFDADRVILAHTPMKHLAAQYADKVVLVLGPDMSRDVALAYGFRKVVLGEEVLAWRRDTWGFRPPREGVSSPVGIDLGAEPIAAVFILGSSYDYGRDAQLILDLLASDGGLLLTRRAPSSPPGQSVPLYLCNSDLLYANTHPLPRLGDGALLLTVEALARAVLGIEKVEAVVYGKPRAVAFECARAALVGGGGGAAAAEEEGEVVMVGDNPATDIAGAKAVGWTAVLTRTGVYGGREGETTGGADVVVEHVGEAVEWVLGRWGKE
ncbi:HAD-like domain-containing protein [Zopfochytrium polystomum]|nr:HAD-like domain-containing protein [Zopfochytrium polystomum]